LWDGVEVVLEVSLMDCATGGFETVSHAAWLASKLALAAATRLFLSLIIVSLATITLSLALVKQVGQ